MTQSIQINKEDFIELKQAIKGLASDYGKWKPSSLCGAVHRAVSYELQTGVTQEIVLVNNDRFATIISPTTKVLDYIKSLIS